jgi:hypothetical protein
MRLSVSIPPRLVLVISLTVVSFRTQGNATQNGPELGKEDGALKTLRQYIELRLHNAKWNEYSKLITWPDEPSWDCHWVVSAYHLGKPKTQGATAEVDVKYQRLGLFCNNPEFEAGVKTVTIKYVLLRGPKGWKVNSPIPDYPEIGADVLLQSLKASAEDAREATERRGMFSAAARAVSAARHEAEQNP